MVMSGQAGGAGEVLADGGCPGDGCLPARGSQHTRTRWSLVPVPAARTFLLGVVVAGLPILQPMLHL